MPVVPQSTAPDQGIILEAMRADLATWGAARRPALDVFWLADPDEPLTIMLGGRGERARVLLSIARDANVNAEVNPPMLYTGIELVVQAGQGMTSRRERLAIQGETGRPSLEEITADVRKRVLSWRMDTTIVHRGFVLYDGRIPYTDPSGIPLSGWRLSFHFRAAAPAVAAGDTVTLTLS